MNRLQIILFALIITLTSYGYGQESNWNLYTSINGIEIYTKEISCDANNIPAQKAIIIKVVNTSAQRMQVEWDKAIWYNDEKVSNSSDDESHETIVLGSNESKQGSCEIPRGPLYLYQDFITYQTETKLTKFELQNVKVVKL